MGVVAKDATAEAGWMVVAEFFSDLRRPFEGAHAEALANARLFAASPELLEALKGALAAWDRLYPSMPGSEAFEDCEFREMQQVRAAIAKAIGSVT